MSTVIHNFRDDFRDFYGRNPEFLSAYTGDISALESCLQKNYQLPITSEQQEAINHGSEKNGGHTTAHFACYGNGDPGILSLLKEYGANLFQQDFFSRPPLFVAANAAKTKMLDYLLREHKTHGKSIFTADCFDRTPVHALCSFGSSPAEKAKDEELAESLELLLSYCLNDQERKEALEQLDRKGRSPVQLAIASGYVQQTDPQTGELQDTELAKVFRKYGVDVDLAISAMPQEEISFQERDFFCRSELMYHAFAGDFEVVREQLAAGANPNKGNPQFGGRTALHLACVGDRGPEFLQEIMQSTVVPVDMKACDAGGVNPLMFAAYRGNLAKVNMLLKGVVSTDGQREVKFPIENLNDQDERGYTALHAAVMSSTKPETRAQVIELLIFLGIDTTRQDKNGKTALELAKSRDNTVGIAAIEAATAKLANAAVDLTASSQNPDDGIGAHAAGTHITPAYNKTIAANDADSKPSVSPGPVEARGMRVSPA